MADKRKLDEITQYAKNFDNHYVGTHKPIESKTKK